jgi:hypothetical protein
MNENQSKCGNAEYSKDAVENSAPGLNDNVEFMGKQLHVQTERIGLPVPRIVTQVFSNGRVVFSKKADIPQGPDSQEFIKIQELMRTQHFQTIREMADKQKQFLGARNISQDK